MWLSRDSPVISPAIVGRADYLETLQQVLQQVASGKGQTVLIAGEAGIENRAWWPRCGRVRSIWASSA